MRRFARWWFGLYVVTSANDNTTYGTNLSVPIGGKRIKIFKKLHEEKPNLNDLGEEDHKNERFMSHEVNEEEEMNY